MRQWARSLVRTSFSQGEKTDAETLLSKFSEFCKVDLQLSKITTRGHLFHIRHFLKTVDKPLDELTVDDVRTYLKGFQAKSNGTYANVVKSLRRFLRDYLGRPELVKTFKFPQITFTPKQLPSKEDLKRFFGVLTNDRDRAVFQLFATSGLRRSELLSLRLDEADLESRTIIPKNAHEMGTTKNTWVTCFNVECQTYLKRYLSNRQTDDKRLVSVTDTSLRRMFKKANRRTDLYITPQVLRAWFCNELGELGVQDRYVDALCGRIPKSILARHYSDFSPHKLKAIYDKADLRVLD